MKVIKAVFKKPSTPGRATERAGVSFLRRWQGVDPELRWKERGGLGEDVGKVVGRGAGNPPCCGARISSSLG